MKPCVSIFLAINFDVKSHSLRVPLKIPSKNFIVVRTNSTHVTGALTPNRVRIVFLLVLVFGLTSRGDANGISFLVLDALSPSRIGMT